MSAEANIADIDIKHDSTKMDNLFISVLFFVISRIEDELMSDLFQVLKFFCFKISSEVVINSRNAIITDNNACHEFDSGGEQESGERPQRHFYCLVGAMAIGDFAHKGTYKRAHNQPNRHKEQSRHKSYRRAPNGTFASATGSGHPYRRHIVENNHYHTRNEKGKQQVRAYLARS